MTAPRDIDAWLGPWLAEAAGEPTPAAVMERVTVEIRNRGPRAGWLARIHDRWTNGGLRMGTQRQRAGLLVLAAVTVVMVAAVVGQLVPGGSTDRKGLVPVVDVSPTPTLPATPVPTATGTPQAGRVTIEMGDACQADAGATLPTGPLPVTARPSDVPMRNGLLAVEESGNGVTAQLLLDPQTGATEVLSVTSHDTPVQLYRGPGWSPDGRWLGLTAEYGDSGCQGLLLVSADRTTAIEVAAITAGRTSGRWLWSPDSRWLAMDGGDRIDVYGIGADGRLTEARTVWQAPIKDMMAIGAAWGADGRLAFRIQDPTNDVTGTVAFLAPGATTPRLVQVEPYTLTPLAWTTDGAAIIARGYGSGVGVSMFRITPDGAVPIPRGQLILHGGKWLDVPETIIGDRIVFAANTGSISDTEGVYTMGIDGSDPRQLIDPTARVGVLFTSSPDGRHVAMSDHGIWDIDMADGSMRQLSAKDARIANWQAVP